MWIKLLSSILVPLLTDFLKFILITPKETAKQISSPLMPDMKSDIDEVIKKYEKIS